MTAVTLDPARLRRGWLEFYYAFSVHFNVLFAPMNSTLSREVSGGGEGAAGGDIACIAGFRTWQWMEKMDEVRKRKISSIALFLSRFSCPRFEKDDRQNIYAALEDAGVKDVPLVHLRHDMGRDELAFLQKL